MNDATDKKGFTLPTKVWLAIIAALGGVGSIGLSRAPNGAEVETALQQNQAATQANSIAITEVKAKVTSLETEAQRVKENTMKLYELARGNAKRLEGVDSKIDAKFDGVDRNLDRIFEKLDKE
jgi:type II secretory pathway pseudopilin PulG